MSCIFFSQADIKLFSINLALTNGNSTLYTTHKYDITLNNFVLVQISGATNSEIHFSILLAASLDIGSNNLLIISLMLFPSRNFRCTPSMEGIPSNVHNRGTLVLTM